MNRKFYPLSFIFALIFAVAFWGYVNLNSVYTTIVPTKLKVKVAYGRAIEDKLPESIFLKVRGTGYELLKLMYFSTPPECQIDFSPRPLDSSRTYYNITQDSLRLGLTAPMNVEILEITPKNVPFRTDIAYTRRVPIEPDVNLNYRRGFTVINDPLYLPDSVTIRGANRIIRSINSWRTSPLTLEDIHQPFSTSIPLKDSLSNVVERSDSLVSISANVQQVAEITFQDILVEIHSSPSNADQVIRPQIVTVTVRGGIRQLQFMLASMIRVSVPYYTLTQDSTGYVKPTVSLPPDVQLVKISPPFLRHTSVQKGLVSELITAPAQFTDGETVVTTKRKSRNRRR